MVIKVNDNLIVKYNNEKDFDNLLLRACEVNNLDCVKYAIKNGANVNFANNFKQSPLMFACLNANVEMIKALEEKGADFGQVDSNGNNLYHYALGLDYSLDKINYNEKNRTECVRLISQNGNADVSMQNSIKISPLHLACRFGFNAVIENLLISGANPNLCDARGDSPLAQCYLGKNGANDDLLLDFGADVNINEWQRHSVLFRVLSSSVGDKKKEIANKLIENGATIEAMQLDYLLDENIAKGVRETAEKMMKKQLVRNIERKNDQVAKKFISREQYDALYEYLVGKKYFNDARLLIQMGYNINMQEKSTGDSRLIKAVKANNNDYVIFLVENGALINLRNKEGKSATECAIENKFKDIALYLLENGGHIYVDIPRFESCNKIMGDKYQDIIRKNAVIFVGNKRKKTGIYAEKEMTR